MLLVFYFIPGALYPILSPKIAGGFDPVAQHIES